MYLWFKTLNPIFIGFSFNYNHGSKPLVIVAWIIMTPSSKLEDLGTGTTHHVEFKDLYSDFNSSGIGITHPNKFEYHPCILLSFVYIQSSSLRWKLRDGKDHMLIVHCIYNVTGENFA
jgi:hypothetical protein